MSQDQDPSKKPTLPEVKVEEEDEKPVPPDDKPRYTVQSIQEGVRKLKERLKVPEEDPSLLSVKEKVRNLSSGSTGSDKEAPGTSEKKRKSGIASTMGTVENLKASLELKQTSMEKDFENLENSLKLEEPDLEDIEANLNYLRHQLGEVRKIHQNLLSLLVKDKDKVEEYGVQEELMSGLTKRFFKQEAVAQKKIADLQVKEKAAQQGAAKSSPTRRGATAVVTGEGEGDTPSTETSSTDQQMSDFKVAYVNNALERIEEQIYGEDNPDLTILPGLFDTLIVQWESYLQCHSTLLEYLREMGMVKQIQTEMLIKERFQKRKLAVERGYSKLVASENPNTSTSSMEHFLHMKEFGNRKDLPKLANNVKEWLPFWALFKGIDGDKKMSNLKKFELLLKSVEEKSEAYDILKSYYQDGENYKAALDHLKRTYGRENVLVKVYVRELLQLGIDRAVGKPMEFRKLVNSITAQMKNLETLGVTEDKCALILYAVLETCLPAHVMQNWQHSGSYKEELKDLMKFLQEEVNYETDRKLARFQFQQQEKKPQEQRKGKFQKDSPGGKKGATPAVAAFHNKESPAGCLFCDGRHKSSQCRNALKMQYEEKLDKMKARRVCFVCLEEGHSAQRCSNRQKVECELCQKKGAHFKLLCRLLKSEDGGGKPKQQQQQQEVNFVNGSQRPSSRQSSQSQSQQRQRVRRDSYEEEDPLAPVGTSNMSNIVITEEVPLQMLVVTVEGATGKKRKVRAVLDTGSQTSSITRGLANEIGFKHLGWETVNHHLFGGGVTPPQRHEIVKFDASGPRGERTFPIKASCVKEITSATSNPPRGDWIRKLGAHGVELPNFEGVPEKIELLIGNNVEPHIRENKMVILENGLVAMETRWGWTLGGEVEIQQPHSSKKRSNNNLNITSSLLNLPISALWDLEALGIMDEPTTQSKRELELQTEEHFVKNVKRNEEGRYVVKLPFHVGAIDTLPSNFYSAEKRMRATTADLRKQGYLEDYNRLFLQWEKDGMIERVAIGEGTSWKESGHFLPHRAVVKLSSSTTPIRPVFDASAKPKGKSSLNQCLEAGPNYLELIPSILTRFRLRRIGVTADIKKAFQQISVAPEHRGFIKFIWWEDPITCEKLLIFLHCRVVFGVACSPFLLAATLNYHLNQSPESHRESAELLRKSLYVDNNLSSLNSMEEALAFQKQCQELLEPALFDLRGWEIGPTEDEKSTPVLGLTWDMKKDTLSINVEAALEKVKGVYSQRTVLAVVHSLYDPLGVISPFIINGKLLLRKCHEEKLGWDKELPVEIQQQFVKWGHQIPILKEIAFPRFVFYGHPGEKSFHVFSDASGEAVAAAVFLRIESEEGVKVSLLHAKSRIAPRKTTIPRLELIGCLIGVRLMKTVAEDIGEESLPTTYYTDSSTALAWIKGEGPWGVFVDNRVKEIRANSDLELWRHVPGKENPADLPSRGCSAKKLSESQWWDGPSWLYRGLEEWPVTKEAIPDITAVEKEKKKCVAANLALSSSTHPVKALNKFSSYPKMLRVASYCLRYRQVILKRVRDPNRRIISNSDLKRKKNYADSPTPTVGERERAEKIILQYVQRDLEEKQLKKLRPFEDQDGLWRTSTRILFQFQESFSQPFILPDKNEIVEKIMDFLHRDNFHVGTQLLLAKVRERFWLLNGRRACRKAVNRCWICRRFRSQRLAVPEPPLPTIRTNTGVPFHVTGVDMAGPLTTKKGEKVWVALFTCATYRAVHLELVDSMSTDDFLLAFRAFVSRRGKPAIVHSDNGLNFVGANTELRRAHQKDVTQFATEKGIIWRFSTVHAPWWGGYWEVMVGIMKTLVRSTLGKRSAHKKELVGLLMEVEEAMNNRPLTYLPETPDDPVPLTPNMLVRNSGLSHFPEMDIRDGTSARAAHKRIQRIREAIRSRFRVEYLGALQHRRPGGTFVALQPGDVVLIEKENEKRVGWPLAVITEVVGGVDGFPRAYRVKTKMGVQPRPIPAQRLFPMELQENIDSTAVAGPSQDE